MNMLAEVQNAVDEDVTDEAQTETQTEARDYEAEARELGWVPKEDFKGDASRWTDAETFVRKGEEVLPLIKAQNKALKRQLDDMKRDLKKASDFFSKSEQRAYERARADIEARIESAVESGDGAAAKAAIADLDKLRDEVKAPKAEATQEEAQEAYDTWREENAWYDKANLASATEIEINARLYADRMVQKHLAKTQELAPADFFAFIGDLVREKYPALRSRPAPRAKPPSDVAGATRAAPRGGKTFADLPPEAQRMCDKWVKQGLIKDRASYVKSYAWD